MPCDEACQAVAFPIRSGGRKVRTPQGSEPDNIRAPFSKGDDKCNRE